MAEQAYAADLNSVVLGHEGSNPSRGTMFKYKNLNTGKIHLSKKGSRFTICGRRVSDLFEVSKYSKTTCKTCRPID